MMKSLLKLICVLSLSIQVGHVVAAPGDNLALTGTATQSSFWTTAWPASNCINGIRESNANSQLCHTQRNSGPNEWFEIDLGVTRNIDVINIFNRNNCCRNRIRNMFVMVSDTPFTNSGNNAASLTSSRAIADYEFQIPITTTGDIVVNANNVLGRYIRIQKSGINPGGPWINLLEVEVIESALPVTLSAFHSESNASKLDVKWSTSSELFNIGFQLWGLDGVDKKWKKLHNWLVRSGSGNAVEPQSYAKTVNIPASVDKLLALGISSIDSDGTEHYYGPFNVGQSYGALNNLKPIAWNQIRNQVDVQMRARGYVKDRVHGYRKTISASITDRFDQQSVVELRVNKAGIYKLSAKAMHLAGIDWSTVEKGDIAVIDHHGNAVVRYVIASGQGSGQAKALGANGEIYFHADELDDQGSLYSDARIYRLVVDRYLALNAQVQTKQGLKDDYSEYYETTEIVEHDRHYNLNSLGDDPWIDSVVLSYADQSRSYASAVPVEADALWNYDASLRLNLSRRSALSPVDANADGVQDKEHIAQAVVLSPNGVGGLLPLGVVTAVGAGAWRNDFSLPANTPLTMIDNKVVVGGVFNAGAGYALSEVHVDSVELTYARPYVAKQDDDYLFFKAPDDGAKGYEVVVPQTGWPLVFAVSDGNLVRIALESQQLRQSANGGVERVVRFAALNGASKASVHYWISGKNGALSAQSISEKSIVSSDGLVSQAASADFLMIAHPAFMSSSLSGYARFKRRQGYRVAIINYLDVVDTFGGGQPGPGGLTQYLDAVNTRYGDLTHVLLVGGSSYDHTDKLGTGALTFIPGHYGNSKSSKYTVTDSLYVTNNVDQLFASIGRWPVRNNDDLEKIIANSMQWTNSDHAKTESLLIAEQTIAGENIDFAAALNDVARELTSDWTTSRVYVDDVAKRHQLNLPEDLPRALAIAKNEIILQLNSSPNLVLYNGHATTSQLSNKGLFKAADVAQLSNEGTQMWLPMSCYLTYYESTHANTFAYQLLFTGKAVGISGAMLLSNQAENLSTAKALIQRTLRSVQTIGQAMTAHKTNQDSPALNINLSHLGDPTLSL